MGIVTFCVWTKMDWGNVRDHKKQREKKNAQLQTPWLPIRSEEDEEPAEAFSIIFQKRS